MYLRQVILFALLGLVAAKKGDSAGYTTTYACEGRTLNIICDKGVIHLIRANYGRFSISICNDHGNLDWRVNCMSHQSFLKMMERCNLKPNCSVNVSSNTFDDPCPGTLKYLEVQYHCGTEIPTFTTPSSSQFLTGKASDATHSENSTRTQTASYQTESTSFIPSLPTLPIITRHSTTTTARPSPTTSSTVDKSLNVQTISTNEVKFTKMATPITKTATVMLTTVTYSRDEHCPPTFSRSINWTWTKAGDIAVSKCPEGASGVAKWFCKLDPVQWSTEAPDLQQCQSLWLENIKARLENGDSIISVTSELALMSITKTLFSEDLRIIGDLIQQALYKSVNSMENFLDMWQRYHVLRELLQSSVQTLSNLLDYKQNTAWNDLPLSDRKLVVSSLLEGLEESALLLAETSSDDGSFNLVRSNVLLSLQVLKSKTLTKVSFPVRADISTEEEGIHWLHIEDSLLLPPQAIQEYSKNGLFKVVFTAFNNLNEYLKPSANILHSSTIDFPENVTKIVNSRMVGASLERSGNPKLAQPVIVTLKHLIERNVTNPVCVYWDFHSRDWSALGCWVEATNQSHTICACDHLTNFAVIMDFDTNMVFIVDLQLLQLVISIGCIFATVCLLVTIIILFTLSANITEDNTFIHRNMFLCLLISEVVFVSGIKQTNFHFSCAIIAGLLQYLFLATFSWVFFECYHQYILLIGTCDAKKEQPRWYYAVAYIVPGVITVVSAIVDPSSYGTKNYCWLQADNYFVFSFVGPAVSIIFGGLVFIVIALCIFCHNQSMTTAIKGQEDINLSIYKWWNQRSIVLMILLTLTWTSGLLYMNAESVFLAYTFALLNSLQGAVILALYCFQNKKVNQELKKISHKHALFCSCCEIKKEEEPHSSGQSAHMENTQREHTSQQFWSLTKNKSLITSIKPPVPDPLSTSDMKSNENSVKTENSERRTAHWKCSYYTQEHELENKSMYPIARDIPNPQHSQYRHFLVGSESNGQFLDHIYETIDGESLPVDDGPTSCQQFPPVENYYGDHSDLSQHSSSSYGYDQQPLLIVGDQAKQPNFHTLSKDSHNVSGKQHMREDTLFSIGHMPTEDVTVSPQNSFATANPLENTVQDTDSTSLPDLLKCPADNTVVLAVLDGDKVVSQVQQGDALLQHPQHKLSTYC